MPLSSTKQSFFLCGREIAGSSKNCDVPKGFKAILLLRREFFTSVLMSRLTFFRGKWCGGIWRNEELSFFHDWLAYVKHVLRIYCLSDVTMHPGKRRDRERRGRESESAQVCSVKAAILIYCTVQRSLQRSLTSPQWLLRLPKLDFQLSRSIFTISN